jgi:hypothetical protein
LRFLDDLLVDWERERERERKSVFCVECSVAISIPGGFDISPHTLSVGPLVSY